MLPRCGVTPLVPHLPRASSRTAKPTPEARRSSRNPNPEPVAAARDDPGSLAHCRKTPRQTKSTVNSRSRQTLVAPSAVYPPVAPRAPPPFPGELNQELVDRAWLSESVALQWVGALAGHAGRVLSAKKDCQALVRTSPFVYVVGCLRERLEENVGLPTSTGKSRRPASD